MRLKTSTIELLKSSQDWRIERSVQNKKYLDQKYGEGSFKVLTKFLQFKGIKLQKILDDLKNDRISTRFLENSYCQSNRGHRDGSATGNYPDGEICISKMGILRDSPATIEAQLVGLFLHEFSHLFGFNEEDAHLLQSIVVKGHQFLLTSKITKDSIQSTLSQVSKNLKKIEELFLKDKLIEGKEGEIYQLINQSSESLEYLKGRVAQSDQSLLSRVVPEYLENDLTNLSERYRGLRSYFHDEVFSTIPGYNVIEGAKRISNINSSS